MSTYFPWLAPSERADQTCLTDANHSLSYRELSESSRAFASQLADHGIGHGDVVAIMLPNRIELVVAILLPGVWALPPRRSTQCLPTGRPRISSPTPGRR